MFKVYYKMPLCYLSLHSDGKFLTRVDFCDNKRSEKNCSLLDLVKYELDLYFTHKLRKFSIPVLIQGTDFESKVYKALMEIPYGKIATYKDIAEKINHPKAFRAVGNANSKNQIPIFIPCHRVIANNGIGGYNGGLEIKRFLLENEGVNLK
ncbi:TPA: methylated-DNA--[protein]-cysteine S-methyltransferase [Campylobacter jejuni]|uniref:methylated-DNA--[protein]-cysteine S-methyltransferase n=1 Tax=Campylobacter jejuni TaxID=197 RepID=UPI000874ECD3|nr:methylated-DNA--[protein]-cysteine S-methyltransferase [Campylobacter jejuni]EAH9819240.1 methylated-DNA--[protein]-cysteine S-methyltransferase [Campylobacter jejuni]EAI0111571.1 methylated-DNA--[protein]-cysteine S-methyltransferase [Campylobacter jejuni]EAI9887593.1 methylated-DNA--[protein]-cysteine S-methyltransferase [Campylobacter jejuni]EAL7792339.1 methylated-DNA--[protein]-cysteine S-methyltransferase [Campylobacter jejuni]EAL8367288.1 methylated-DNA--[protein]-cysteine S-methyltr